ncbi:type I-F CRISPR-associated protein Csy1 [Xanthomonas albilineans]|uniref:Probable crispr-associated protein, csy1 family n=1 Tax=Xanthomonas albilineans (strain GPE PC73 / CFBP 7063) TaxID=380358 RepID=D2UGL6_XANAP|nr:type I-F CRISPR-associated protein Csy1 [Xanthomonas albilineans]QHQ29785.1 putative CRISPR-associated protein csy1 family [Xanthomonas albilineans]CBA17527.1 probable crispr-associated protein, csy1 family [Xanthomonas albilineans GPE PC73]
MTEDPQHLTRSERFRSAIAAFIDARREAKLKGNEGDSDTDSKYDYATWLSDAARRVSQIQAVTHVLKATHPDARGSSLHVAPTRLQAHTEVGTHVLGTDYAEDVVGNAAALDVFKLLKLEVDGRRLLDWMQDDDADLRVALHDNAKVASDWMGAFCNLVRHDALPSSHQAAKQVYWLVGDEPREDTHYHLLQPLFSSSLAHAVHADIQDARFGERNKQARQAYRDKHPFDGTYHDYRNLVARKLGGTKPQNISQLNSERGGINYLLASLPPRWTQEERPRTLLKLDSALDRFAYFDEVPTLIKKLADFLATDPPKNDATQKKREGMENDLINKLALFAAETAVRFEPGWSRNPDCVLPLSQQLWLDAERVELPIRIDPEHAEWEQQDRNFVDTYHLGDWQDEIAGQFATWLNDRLRAAGITGLGDDQYRHWAKQAIVDAAWPVPMRRRAPAGGVT